MTEVSYKKYTYHGFDKFMLGYWNQMASEMYLNLSEAIKDFKITEGNVSLAILIDDILELDKLGTFPAAENLLSAHSDKFWSRYDRVITKEQLQAASGQLLR